MACISKNIYISAASMTSSTIGRRITLAANKQSRRQGSVLMAVRGFYNANYYRPQDQMLFQVYINASILNSSNDEFLTSKKTIKRKLSTSSTSESEKEAEEILKSSKKKFIDDAKQQPRALFPWRHSEELPKDINLNFFADVGVSMNLERIGALSGIMAWLFLNHPWHEVLIRSEWKKDYASSFAWAFSQAVSGILSNVYKQAESEDAKNNGDEKASSAETSKTKKTTAIGSMLENKLLNLYASAYDNGKDQLEVHLEMKVKEGELFAFYGIPFLSRAAVEEKPSRIFDHFRVMSSFSTHGVKKFLEEFHSHSNQMFTERGKLETTIVAVVLIYCDEVFCVKEKNSGTVLQGYEDKKVRPVVHVVKFERNVALPSSQFEEGAGLLDIVRDYGEWQITDIDGLLNGNPWDKKKK